ncbi:MAG: transposase [Thermogemmata sp.]
MTLELEQPCSAGATQTLRIELAGSRYLVAARSNEQQAIFRDACDHQHFLELLSVLPNRFGAQLHTYLITLNHHHLLLEAPDGNLNWTLRWLNANYSVWFNWQDRRRPFAPRAFWRGDRRK